MRINRYDRSSRIHIIILYLLITCLVILWGVSFIYIARTIRNQVNELKSIKQRLTDLEAVQITITSSVDEDDALQRQSRHARLKSKLFHKQQPEEISDGMFGSIHFKVPVRNEEKKVIK